MLFAVRIGTYTWGPFLEAADAAHFAQFATREIDPARVVMLHDPTAELLSWYRSVKRKGGDKMSSEQYTPGEPEVHTEDTPAHPAPDPGPEVAPGREARPGADPRPENTNADDSPQDDE